MSSSRRPPVGAHQNGERRSFLRSPVIVGRTGDPKNLRQALLILGRMLRDDAVTAVRYYYLVKLAGARLIPRPLRYLLYRVAGVRLEQSYIAAGLLVDGPPSNLTIGHGTSINVDCFFDCLAKVSLGRGVMVGMGVTIVTSDHPVGPDGRPQGQPIGRDVVIGDRAWLGARAMVLPGVVVGEGVIVSAGAVVTRDCRPFAVYAGVPARLVGHLANGTDQSSAASAGSDADT